MYIMKKGIFRIGVNVLCITLCFIAVTSKVFSDESLNSNVIELLESRKYEELRKEIGKYQSLYEEGSLSEDDIYDLFYQFFKLDPNLEDNLIEWIGQDPGFFGAYLARGIYYKNLGWKKRGGRFIHATTRESLDGMQFYFEKAFADLNRSVELNERSILSYCYIIDILRHFNQEDVNREVVKVALENSPDSLLVRWFYLLSLTPRWGGSYDKMNIFLEETRGFYGLNPELKVLEGRIFVERGDQKLIHKRYNSARILYEKALEFGEHYYYRRKKGESLYYLKRYEEAIDDFDKSLQERSRSLSTLNFRALSYTHLGNCVAALEDYDKILEIDSSYPGVKKNKKYCLNQLK